MIQCNTCKKEYEAIWQVFEGSKTQAFGCASEIYMVEGDYYLHGHYGSRVADMRKYFVKDDAQFSLGIICDECITKLDKEGKIDLIADGVWS